MNRDEYGEVINGVDTYGAIVASLKTQQNVLIGWTDEAGTHFDILFSYKAFKQGTVQGGIRWDDLYVSIMRLGAFGFAIENTDTAPAYYAEKLHVTGDDTTKRLAELINEVKKRLR